MLEDKKQSERTKEIIRFKDNYEDLLIDVLQKCEQEDDFIRQQQIKEWKRNDLYYHGEQHIFWNQIVSDWDFVGASGVRSGSLSGIEETRDSSGPLYDYVLNIFKAHG